MSSKTAVDDSEFPKSTTERDSTFPSDNAYNTDLMPNASKCYDTCKLGKVVLDDIRSEISGEKMLYNNFQEIFINNIPISQTLLNRLCNNQVWLNDEMINAYLHLLEAAYESSMFFNTHFITSLQSGLNVTNIISNKKTLLNYALRK